MIVTNKAGLPGAIVEAVRNDDYNPGSSDITVTQLIGPPRIRVLKKAHGGEIVEDVSDLIFALMGKAIHYILERSEPTAVVEERLYVDVDGWTLGGQFDRMTIRQATLQDYKVCSVWEYIYGLKPDRIAQLNVLRYLASRNGYANLSKLEVVAIFRDWQKSKAKFDRQYPQQQVARMSVPFWADEEVEGYIKERVAIHRLAENNLPLCTRDERWASDDKWAVMKKGRKSAVRVLNDPGKAEEMAREKGSGHFIEHRPGTNRRCDDYCSVAAFCDQYKALKGQNAD